MEDIIKHKEVLNKILILEYQYNQKIDLFYFLINEIVKLEINVANWGFGVYDFGVSG